MPRQPPCSNGANDPANPAGTLSKRLARERPVLARFRAAGLTNHGLATSEVTDSEIVTEDGRRFTTFATYNYLAILRHPKIAEASQAALARYGPGTHGVRLNGGTLDLHHRLEARIAEFVGREDAITFSSGFIANLTTIHALTNPGDGVFSDDLNHASIVDGCRLSNADYVTFRHNDADNLSSRLRLHDESALKLVVADSVFSMDGDILNLPAVRQVCRREGAVLMVDEAHSLGVLGAGGRGIFEHYGLQPEGVTMGTLSKAIPAMGGFIAGDADLIDYLRFRARAYIFSAALAPAVAGAALGALDVLDDEGPDRRKKLYANVNHLLAGLREAGFDTGNTTTPIVPVLLGRADVAIQLAQACIERGIYTRPIIPPAVPNGSSRLRFNVTAAHSASQIDQAVRVLSDAARALGVTR